MSAGHSYAGHFLLAMPHVLNEPLEKSIIYLFEDSQEGVLGLTLNFEISVEANVLTNILEGIELASSAKPSVTLMLGGGSALDEGLILTSARPETFFRELSGGWYLSRSKGVLNTLLADSKAQPWYLLLGHLQWSKHTLDAELADNRWLMVSIPVAEILAVPAAQRWYKGLNVLQIQVGQLLEAIGHA